MVLKYSIKNDKYINDYYFYTFMTIQEDLFEIPKMIKVGSKTHTELSILKAKWNLPKLEDVIIELLAKTNQNDEIQDINGHKG